MKSNWYITIGVLGLLLVVMAVFFFKASGSENATYVEGCTPYNVEIRKGVEENSIDILWKSREKCSGYILYGKEMKSLELVGVDIQNETLSKEHIITLEQLLNSKEYYFSIVSNGISFGKDGLPLQFSIDSL
jgi:hypothetical protein